MTLAFNQVLSTDVNHVTPDSLCAVDRKVLVLDLVMNALNLDQGTRLSVTSSEEEETGEEGVP